MKLTVKTKNLLKAVQFSSAVLKDKTTLPSLNHLLIEVVENSLTVTGSDLFSFARHTCETEGTEKGSFGVPGRLFQTFLSGLDTEDATMILEGFKLTVESGGSRAKFSVIMKEEFSVWPKNDTAQSISLPESTLHDCLRRVSPAIYRDSSVRANLSGVNMQLTCDALTFTASEGHIIAQKSVPYIGEGEWLIPADTVGHVLKSLDPSSDNLVDISLSVVSATFTTKSWTIQGALVDSEFPKSALIVLKDRASGELNPLVINTSKFRASIKRASAFATQQRFTVVIDVKNDGILFSSVGEDHSGRDFLPMECPREFKFAINPKYLDSMLSVMTGETIQLDYRDEMSPILLMDGDFMVVIMPMRL